MSKDIKAGGAYVELMLRDKKFLSKLGAAGRKLVGFAKGAAVAGAAVAAAAAGGVAYGVRQYIKMGDALDKMSKRTGVSVESLSELKHAAELSGASAEQLERGFMGLSRALFDASRGSAEPVEALRRIGLTFEDLKGLKPEEQMSKIADGLSKVADASDRGAIAQRLMGRQGRQLLPMFENGAAGMDAMRQQARDMGLSMSTEAAAGAARLLDALTVLGSQLKVLAFEVGAAAAPFVEAALPAIQQFAKGIIDNVSVAADYVMPVVSAIYDTMLTAFTSISEMVAAVWGTVSDNTGSAMNWMQETVIGAMSTVSFSFKEWKLLTEMAMVSAQLQVVRFGSQLGYWFGTVIPGWLSWFGEHWHEVFADIVNFTGTVATNIWKNLANLWDAIVGLFNGEGFDFKFVGLTEGFRSAITELPKIAAREIGPMEKQLQDQLNGLADSMVTKFEAHDKAFKAKASKFKAADLVEGKIKTPELPGAEGISGAVSGAKNKIFATFSAAAAAAQGQGGGKEEKIVDAITNAQRRADEWSRKQVAAIESSLTANA